MANREAITRPSGRGKKGEVVWQSIDDRLLVIKQRQHVSMVAYQDSPLRVQASRLTFFEDEPHLHCPKQVGPENLHFDLEIDSGLTVNNNCYLVVVSYV